MFKKFGLLAALSLLFSVTVANVAFASNGEEELLNKLARSWNGQFTENYDQWPNPEPYYQEAYSKRFPGLYSEISTPAGKAALTKTIFFFNNSAQANDTWIEQAIRQHVLAPLENSRKKTLVPDTMQSPCTNTLTSSSPSDVEPGLSIQSLDQAWRKAHWRKGMHPYRFYNASALIRLVVDKDLSVLAKTWLRYNSEPTTTEEWADASYQFLVNLGDLRERYGYQPNSPTPLLNYLETMLKILSVKNHSIDLTQDLTIIQGWNDFFHLDSGFDKRREQEALKYMNDQIVPRLMILEMIEAFR